MSDVLTEQLRADTLAFPATLPVLPLKETLVFPDSMTPLAIGQDRSIKLIEDVVSGEQVIALVAVRNPDVETPSWDDLYEVGTAARVHKMMRVPDGTLRILVTGAERVRLGGQIQAEPYLVGEFSEEYEIFVFEQAMHAVGHTVHVVCPDKKAGDVLKTSLHDFEGHQTYTEKIGHD